MKTTLILFRTEANWHLQSYKGDTILGQMFTTAKKARKWAKQRKYGVKRAANCDA